MLCAEHMRCNHQISPLGINKDPLLSWIPVGREAGKRQSAYQIQVSAAADDWMKALLWDSGKVHSGDNQTVYHCAAPKSNAERWWRVKLWDENDTETDWSRPARWRYGIFPKDWQGKWIGYDEGREQYDPSIPYYCADDFQKGKNHPFLPKPALLRRTFAAHAKGTTAILYVSAMGLTEVWLNGKKATAGHMIPGICDYRKRVYCLAYDVSDWLIDGQNVLSAVLADGWYAGYIGLNPRQWWGAKPRLNLELHIDDGSGHWECITTDEGWRACTGPWLYADIMHGTGYDATLEPTGWKRAEYDDRGWRPVQMNAEYHHIPSMHPGVPIVEHARYEPISFERLNDNEAIVDFGRCFSGVIDARLRGKRGSRVDFYHAEELDREKKELYYFGNRSAQSHDCYVLAGGEEEYFQPEFTYHGFRYVHVYGLTDVQLLEIHGVAISSMLPEPTELECGSETVNQVIQMIRNTEQSNLYDMPTDVCARDERLGWGCEGHLFMHTAAAFNHSALFLRKWLQDALDGQREDGCFWAIAPAVMMRDIAPFAGDLQSDIALHCAWLLMQLYNDRQPVEAAFPALERYFAYTVRNSDRLLRFATACDWLDLSHEGRSDFDHGYGGCNPALIGTAWFACSASMMAKIASYLGKEEAADAYRQMYSRIRQAFRTFFLGRNLTLRGSTQGGYLLAAAFGLIEGDELTAARNWVKADMQRSGGITWGTATTPAALRGMCRLGLEAEAVSFLQSTAYPSIGYMHRCGATTVWERWDAIYEGRFHPHQMNAFDHIGLATVGEWIVSRLAGIEALEPGYKRVALRPLFSRSIGSMKAVYHSVRGDIRVEWECGERFVSCMMSLPAGVQGELTLPCTRQALRISRGQEHASIVSEDAATTTLHLESGEYRIAFGITERLV